MKRIIVLLLLAAVTLLACNAAKDIPFSLFATKTPTPTLTPTPTPTQNPTPTPTPIVVNPGDDLAEAILHAPEGETILLSAGTYYLTEPLDIRKPIHLIGAGMYQTEIVSETSDYVVRFSGDGPFIIEEITFRYKGSNPADVVIVESGEFSFSHCLFTGAIYVKGRGDHAGLFVQGNATGSVQESKAIDNRDAFGIFITGNAVVNLEANDFSGNYAGVAYYQDAMGEVQHNNFTQNDVGIVISSRAAPIVEDNTFTYNELACISYFEMASGAARRNQCSNSNVGILIFGQASPILEQNECWGNRFGISISTTAHPILMNNNLHDNTSNVEYFTPLTPTPMP